MMKPRPPIFPVVPVLLATSVLAATGLEAAPAYTIQPVPRPEWANSPLSISPIPRRINNRGVIMGELYLKYYGVYRSYVGILRNGQWEDCGTLEGTSGTVPSGINDLGQVVGTFRTPPALVPPYASDPIAVVSPGTGCRMPTTWDAPPGGAVERIPGLDYGSTASDINDAGQIVGAWVQSVNGTGYSQAFLYTPGASITSIHDAVLRDISAGVHSTYSSAVNSGGDVVGIHRYSSGGTRPFLYRNGVAKELIGSGLYGGAIARCINDAGQIAGEGFVPGAPEGHRSHAVLWDPVTGAMTDLRAHALGAVASYARGLNARGDVVGQLDMPYVAGGDAWSDRPFLYTAGGIVDLNTLLPPGSGWTLIDAYDINDSGQIIGWGFLNGKVEYFLMTLASQPPTVTLEGSLSVDEGTSLTIAASAADPEEQALIFDWDLDDDGSFETASPAGSVTFSAATIDGPGARTVRVRVKNEDDLEATATAEVTIRNVAPTATFAVSPSVVYSGQTATLSFSGAVDSSAADTAAGFSYAYDCTSDGIFEVADSPAPTLTCAYTLAGTQTILGRIEDKDGGFTDYTVTVNVLSLRQRIGGLLDIVLGFGLPGGIETSFTKKLEHAATALEAGDTATACSQLQDFINHAEAQSGKKLTVGQASQIIAEAEAIRAALGCS